MGLFKRRPDPLTIAMSIVDQFRSGDPGAAQRAGLSAQCPAIRAAGDGAIVPLRFAA